MTVGIPIGYRLPASVGITALSRRLVVAGQLPRRDQAIHVIAGVMARVLESSDRDAVFRSLSNGQVGDSDLAVCNAGHRPLVARVAEFVDVLHSALHSPFALPPDAWLDLRFELRFVDDPGDSGNCWTYALLGTESEALQHAWQAIPGVELFAFDDGDDSERSGSADRDSSQEHGEIWARVLAPFATANPLCWTAPDPQLLFDILDSLDHPESDEAQAAKGRVTVPLVLAELQRLTHDESAGLDQALTT
jgi:hypothetical protein